MKTCQLLACAGAGAILSLVSGCATAYGIYPTESYDMTLHPNIAAADSYASQAIVEMHAAQQANRYQLGGHAGRAIALMEQARAEMQAAAVTATR
jgi:hypothetical protein